MACPLQNGSVAGVRFALAFARVPSVAAAAVAVAGVRFAWRRAGVRCVVRREGVGFRFVDTDNGERPQLVEFGAVVPASQNQLAAAADPARQRFSNWSSEVTPSLARSRFAIGKRGFGQPDIMPELAAGVLAFANRNVSL